MTENNFQFNALVREKVGKGSSRELRRNAMVPASVYGDKKDPISVALNPKEVKSQMKRTSMYGNIYVVEIKDHNDKSIAKEEVLVRDISLNPVTDEPIHVNLLRVGKNIVTDIEVPLIFKNQTKRVGLKAGGILNIVTHSLQLRCNPKNAPKNIEVDLSDVRVGDVIKIENIKLADGIKTFYPKGYAIVSITAPAEEATAKTNA